MDNVKIAKELIKIAKLLSAAPNDEQIEEQDAKIVDMIKLINSKKSALSSKGKKKCGTLNVDEPKLKQLTVQDLITALYQIANDL